ncbi:CAP domain-containing protein [Streptomyces sp. NPDC003717]|uniref:CAP domain-containing protein n=1 Tax=Streptomyces sp. NPDC003717 TaxID=3154276 RepID=UPI0033A708A0
MGSRRATHSSRARARHRRGPGRRGAVLALGAVTVTAGVGITFSVLGGGDGGASDQVTTNAAGEVPGDAVPLASATGSASASAGATASGTPGAAASASAEAKAKAKEKAEAKAKASASAARRARPTVKSAPAASPARSHAGGSSAGGDGSPAGSGAGSGTVTGSGSGSDTRPSSGSGGTGGSGDTGGSAAGGPEAQVLALVNQERSRAGCSPLTANGRLTTAADDYSDVMAASGVMSHTGPDGSTMAGRVEAAGYQWSALGENIARGQADAASVMNSWMNSPGHRANILNCSFKELGVGVHMGDGGPWWTQDFGTGR